MLLGGIRVSRAAEELGLKTVNVPMDYWSLATGAHDEKNEDAVERIEDLIKRNPGKNFYIHCYLGRHRVGYVEEFLLKNYIANINRSKIISEQNKVSANGTSSNYVDQRNVRVISKNIVVGSYLYREQLADLKGRYKIDTVISLLDPSLLQERALYCEENKSAEELGLKIVNVPMDYWSLATGAHDDKNEDAAKQIEDLIKSNPGKNFYIHSYLGINRVGYFEKGLLKSHIVNTENAK